MDLILDAKLVSDFPNLYRAREFGITQTMMCWGFECGDGWEPLIRKLSEKLEALILKMPEEERQHCYAQQVKEKYGGLRFYMSTDTDEMYNLISEAEKESEHICEVCGKPGKIRGEGWIYCACEEHVQRYPN